MELEINSIHMIPPLPGWEGIEGRVKDIDFTASGSWSIIGRFILADFFCGHTWTNDKYSSEKSGEGRKARKGIIFLKISRMSHLSRLSRFSHHFLLVE